jgi:hypothetical protein
MVRISLLNIAAVADSLARGVYPACHGRVRNDPALPDRGNEIVLADHAVTIGEQINEEIENLRLHSNQAGAVAQLTSLSIKHMVAKTKSHLPTLIKT